MSEKKKLEIGTISGMLQLDARMMFNETGILVDKDETYIIEMIEVKEQLKDLSIKVKDFDGFNFSLAWLFRPRLKSAAYFSLCGGYGTDDSGLFWIGQKMIFTAQHSGMLFLFINDYKTAYTYKNNKGRMSYLIKRIS